MITRIQTSLKTSLTSFPMRALSSKRRDEVKAMTQKLDEAIEQEPPKKKKRGWLEWMKRDENEISVEAEEYQFIKRIKDPMFY
jgi:hypothetical protein